MGKYIENLLEKEKDFLLASVKIKASEAVLGCVDGKIVGTGRSDYTTEATDYNLVVRNKPVTLIDVPGIEGNESEFEETIKKSVGRAHVIFFVNGSGKKIETETLEKIKKYMHDGTSLYSLINVVLKPKTNRDTRIDKAYEEELAEKYRRYQRKGELVELVENELKESLGDSYRGTICLNGLLAFCAEAVRADGKSSIACETEKRLRRDQEKLFAEYANDTNRMRRDGHISSVLQVIEEKADSFDHQIYEENIRKLKKRLSDAIEIVTSLEREENKKIKGYLRLYKELDDNCRRAKDDYIQNIRRLGNMAAKDAFLDTRAELLGKIEKDKGRTKQTYFDEYFQSHKEVIVKKVETAINKKLVEYETEYKKEIKEARERFIKDASCNTDFNISISAGNMSFNSDFMKSFDFGLKDLGEALLTIGSMAFSFAVVGSIIPGVGTVIGGIVGGLIGLGFSIADRFISEPERIRKAQSKLSWQLDEKEYEISENVRERIKELKYEGKIENKYRTIKAGIDTQKKSLEAVRRVINNVLLDLKKEYNSI